MGAHELPSGTVTLLFTDIEGSTRMLQDLGHDAYVRALTDHRRLLRETVADHRGVEVEMQGDSFHFAFASACDAVKAAVAGQAILATHPWESEPIRVRMGLHTGEPTRVDGLYAGIDIHRAARVMSVGHGGQVLLSERTAELVSGGCLGEVALVDLGEHRLKDLSALERLFQAGPGEFPVPNLLRPSLPATLTRLIGREQDVANVVELLRRKEARLLTLVGAGGIGKTRLALQAAAELGADFTDGVVFVSLASIRDPEQVTAAIAKAVGARERAGTSPADTLAAFLADRRLLLVLDNFEQLIDAGADVANLLRAAPEMSVLVTSREPLRVGGERLFVVQSLSFPDGEVTGTDAAAHAAVELFVDRARAVAPSFALSDENASSVAAICATIDGLPLAIELAAARVETLSPEAILRRLDRRLDLLVDGARDADVRQRTLRATIEWSYELLDEDERRLLAGISVFAGGCRVDAAGMVLDPDGALGLDVLRTLAGLTSKNLLRRQDDSDGEPRFSMLYTIREYAIERLAERADAAKVRLQFVQWCARLAEEGAAGLRSALQLRWMQRLSDEYVNLRAGLELALQENGELAQALVGSLGEFWDLRGDVVEGRAWTTAVSESHPTGNPRDIALVRLTDGVLAFTAGDFAHAADQSELAADQARQASDEELLARALTDAAWSHALMGRLDQARVLCDESLLLARERDDKWTLASATHCKALTEDSAAARSLFEASERMFREIGDSFYRTRVVGNYGWTLMEQGEYERALPHFEESLALSRDVHDVIQIANSSIDSAICRFLRGDAEGAVPLLGQALQILTRVPSSRIAAEALALAAALVQSRGDQREAWRLAGAAEQLLAASGSSASATEQRLLDRLGSRSSPAAEADLASGRSLSLADAVREALAVVQASTAPAKEQSPLVTA